MTRVYADDLSCLRFGKTGLKHFLSDFCGEFRRFRRQVVAFGFVSAPAAARTGAGEKTSKPQAWPHTAGKLNGKDT